MLGHLFFKKCIWKTITYLNVEYVQSTTYGQNDQWFEYLTVQSGFFPALREVKFSMPGTLSFAGVGTPCWKNLHTMEVDSIYQPRCHVLASIAEGVDAGIFPSLKVVRLCNWDDISDTDKLSLTTKDIFVHFVTRDIIR